MEKKLKEFTMDEYKDRFLNTAQSAAERMRWSLVLAGAGSVAERKKVESSFADFRGMMDAHLKKLNTKPVDENKWETMSESSKIDELKRQLDQFTVKDEEEDNLGSIALQAAEAAQQEIDRMEGRGLVTASRLGTLFTIFGRVPHVYSEWTASITKASSTTSITLAEPTLISPDEFSWSVSTPTVISLLGAGTYIVIVDALLDIFSSTFGKQVRVAQRGTLTVASINALGTRAALDSKSCTFTKYCRMRGQWNLQEGVTIIQPFKITPHATWVPYDIDIRGVGVIPYPQSSNQTTISIGFDDEETYPELFYTMSTTGKIIVLKIE